MGLWSTANAGRSGFRSTPEVGATNCFLEPGHHTPEALIGMAGTGLFVTEVMGVHTVDPISGDFSLGVAGVKIENGRITRPVRGVTVAGNIKDLLKNIQAVGNDLRFFGVFGSPSVLISGLVVSGA
jgi:PmbA protein